MTKLEYSTIYSSADFNVLVICSRINDNQSEVSYQ